MRKRSEDLDRSATSATKSRQNVSHGLGCDAFECSTPNVADFANSSRSSHFFLTNEQVNEQQIERDEFEPEIINWLADEQQRK